jgi:hypothetical protein
LKPSLGFVRRIWRRFLKTGDVDQEVGSGPADPSRRADPRDAAVGHRGARRAAPADEDNGAPVVIFIEGLLTRFRRTLGELWIRHVRTRIETPWTNGKAEAFWATLQATVLDRQYVPDVVAAR